MIIFGTRGVTYSYNKGDFHCPSCGSQRPYNHKRVRRFFTLYFIPVLPLDLLGEYIECPNCRGTYRTEVLNFDPGAQGQKFEAEFHRAIKRVMVLMMLADGVVEDEEVEVIRKIYSQLTDSEMSEDDVHDEIKEVQRAKLDVKSALSKCVGFLNEDGKKMVVKAAFLVAAADGVFQDEEKALIATIGQSLGLSSAQLNSIIGSMMKD